LPLGRCRRQKRLVERWEQIYHNDFAYIPSGACELKSGSAFGQRKWELSAGATAIAPTLDPSATKPHGGFAPLT
jgi:hypothetical protein